MKSTSHPSRRSLSLLFAILLMGFAAHGAVQDSESYFHQGARHFLATNEIAQARQTVTNGLKIYPDDAKLKKLWDLLNQKGDDQSQSDQKQQDQKDKENKDQQSKDQQQKDQQDKEQQDKKSEEQKKQEQKDQASNQDKKSEEEKKQGQQASDKKGEEQPEGEGQPQAGKMAKMTPQQAMQLLEALKAEEKAMPFRPILKTNRQDRVFKDW